MFVSRSTHVMVVDGATGKVLGDIKDTPRVHGIAFAPKAGLGFTTNGGDSTSTMFDLKTLDVKKKVKAGKDGLDGIMYDDATDKILTINHSKPMGTAVVIDPKTRRRRRDDRSSRGDAPEGGVSDGKGRIFINLEDKNAIDVIDTKTWKVVDDVEDRAVRRPDRHRDGSHDESHLLGLQQEVGRRRRDHRQGRRRDRER